MRILLVLVLLSGCSSIKEESELRYIRGYIVDIRKAKVTTTVHPMGKKNDTNRAGTISPSDKGTSRDPI